MDEFASQLYWASQSLIKLLCQCGADQEDWVNKKISSNLNYGNNSPGLNRASEHTPTNLTVRAPMSSDILGAPCNSADNFVFKHKFFTHFNSYFLVLHNAFSASSDGHLYIC